MIYVYAVYYLYVACQGVALYVQWFASLACSIEGSCRLEVIVVALPCVTWPASMAHPYEQALQILRVSLVHSTISFIVLPLGKACKFVGRCNLAEHLLYNSHERCATLSACLRKVVLSPSISWSPFNCVAKCFVCAFGCHNVGHSTFGMQFSALFCKVSASWLCPIWSVSTYSLVCRRRYV